MKRVKIIATFLANMHVVPNEGEMGNFGTRICKLKNVIKQGTKLPKCY